MSPLCTLFMNHNVSIRPSQIDQPYPILNREEVDEDEELELEIRPVRMAQGRDYREMHSFPADCRKHVGDGTPWTNFKNSYGTNRKLEGC